MLKDYPKQGNLNILDWVLYIVGFGILLNIGIGLGVNFILPLFGVDRPFTPEYITPIWVWLHVALVIVILYLPDSFFPQLLKFDKSWIPPIVIYICSVLLIYAMTLQTSNLVGSDVHLEYYHANQTLINGYWDYSTFDPVNLCLPITILLPMYSLLINIDMFTVIKVVQPLVMGLIPLVLYRIYRIQFGQTVAILATVFFITLPMFNMDLVQLVRQQYAMFFFALVALLFVGNRLGIVAKVILAVAFSGGVIISHYGLGVGFSGYIFFTVIFIALFRVKHIQRAWTWLVRMKGDLAKNLTANLKYQLITLSFLTATCLGFIWIYYSSVAGGAGMSAVGVVQQLASSTVKDIQNIGNTTSTQVSIILSEPLLYTAIGLDFMDASILGKVWRILLYIVELCFVIGFIRLLIRPNSVGKIKGMFFAFIVASVAIIAGMYVLHTSAYGLGASRVFGVALIFAMPLFIYGIHTFSRKYYVVVSSCLIGVFFLFNSGVVFEVTKSPNLPTIDIPYSIVLSSHRCDITSRFELEDIKAADWISEHLEDDYKVYGDVHGTQLMYQRYGYYRGTAKYLHEINYENSKGFMFLRKHNVDTESLTWGSSYGCRKSIPWKSSEFEFMMLKGEVVYEDGAMVVFIDYTKE